LVIYRELLIKNWNSFTSRDDFKPRLAALLGVFTCVTVGILLFLSIGASFFRWNFINDRPGNLFTGAYGLFAFFIPLYLFWAAWILADPAFMSGRIFLLSSAIIPFLTLALGFSFIRDFDLRSKNFALLETLGISGFGFVVITAVVLECAGIMILHSILFKKSGDTTVSKEPFAVPAAETVPGILPEAIPETNPPEEIQVPVVSFDLPEWHSLKSADALNELNRKHEADDYSILEEIDKEQEETLFLDNSAFLPYAQTSKLGLSKSDAGKPIQQDQLTESNSLTKELTPAEQTILEEAASLFVNMGANITKQAEPEPLHEPAHIPQTAKKKLKASRGSYSVPIEGILNQYPDGQYWIIDEDTNRAACILQETLSEFGIQAEVTGIRKGPVITMFEILPAPGVKLSKIVNLQDNIALRLAASSVRIVAPIPGKHAVGIEVPNKKRNIVSFREIIEGELYNKKEGRRNDLPIVLGKDITGEAVTVDLTQMPHLLIAGATGSGKSVCVNSMILSILYQLSPAECRLIMIDPKIVELKLYNDIPHLLTPVITEPKRAFQALQYCIYEMERRYACLDSMGVRDIKNYNRRIKERNIAAERMPYIVVIIDEFADLMATTGKELESTVARLAAMSRAVGVHLVLATQRPSIDVITGLIKANIPSRIAFMVASKMDSRIIIDMVGAEKLLGKGDMLYAGVVDPFPIRMQGAFISEEEVERVVDYVKSLGEPEYIDDEIFYDEEEETGPSLFSEGDDPLYDKALEVVMQQGKASASYIQRRLKIGYNRAARLVEEMEHRGVVGPAQGSRPRELLRSA
jgi:S-DNA-T family DNA segregation ATPase FtsK/SpoIIIE